MTRDRHPYYIASILSGGIVLVSLVLRLTGERPEVEVAVAAPTPRVLAEPKSTAPSKAAWRRSEKIATEIARLDTALPKLEPKPEHAVKAAESVVALPARETPSPAREPQRPPEAPPPPVREAPPSPAVVIASPPPKPASVAPPVASTPPSAESPGTAELQGTWVGTYPCVGGDLTIAMRLTARGALVYFHGGSAAAPVAPGCYTARWNYKAERTLLEVQPQGWLWRTGQGNPLRLSGWYSGDYIIGGAEEMAGCRDYTLHKRGNYEFPADCR